MRALLLRYRAVINSPDRLHRRQDVLNIVGLTFNIDHFISKLRAIYLRQHTAFKINLSFSFVLRNIESG